MFHRLMNPPQDQPLRKEVETLQEFAPRFLNGHSRANRQTPSGIAAKDMILRVHLVPALGSRKLDAIKSKDVQQLKCRLATKAPKTVNNILRDEWRAGARDSGTGGAQGSLDDAAVHALESRGDRGRDPVVGSTGSG